MKAKLLRKIRKAYVIKEVSKVTSRCSHDRHNAKEWHGLPFFCVKFNWGYLGSYELHFKDIQEAKDCILGDVIKKHKRKMPKKNPQDRKVWHFNK